MTFFRRAIVAAALLAAMSWGVRAQPTAAEYLVYFGTYTTHASKGIYAYRFQPGTGKLTSLGVAAETPSPSFLAVHPGGRFLYAANEHDPAIPAGKNDTISAFSIDRGTGKLTFLNKVSAEGTGPAHISTDKTGT